MTLFQLLTASLHCLGLSSNFNYDNKNKYYLSYSVQSILYTLTCLASEIALVVATIIQIL